MTCKALCMLFFIISGIVLQGIAMYFMKSFLKRNDIDSSNISFFWGRYFKEKNDVYSKNTYRKIRLLHFFSIIMFFLMFLVLFF